MDVFNYLATTRQGAKAMVKSYHGKCPKEDDLSVVYYTVSNDLHPIPTTRLEQC
jgi:hypothetical protein